MSSSCSHAACSDEGYECWKKNESSRIEWYGLQGRWLESRAPEDRPLLMGSGIRIPLSDGVLKI